MKCFYTLNDIECTLEDIYKECELDKEQDVNYVIGCNNMLQALMNLKMIGVEYIDE